MTAVLVDGLQIVPGYRLEVRLGKGGFGEVWRAIGPGKVPVALKIIAAKGSLSGEREFKSLDLLRDLRHPNLLPVQAYWLLDDDGNVIDDDRPPSSIVIAMLLGGKNLRERLVECRKGGIAGIPPRELLELMRDAAKGIDFLNKPIHKLGDRVVAIQHRDIKPENLMIVGGGLMVADFGISGVMESDHAHTTNAAMTFNYAAPELFDYTATAWTDQYALAISYAELRCGRLPFPPHSSPMQVIRIHTEGRHDFLTFSTGEQEVLRRATSKIPEHRFPTCQEMIAALEAAVRAANLLDEVLPLSHVGDQVSVPSELQATRLERSGDTDPKTAPMLSGVTSIPGQPLVPPATQLSGTGTAPLDNITGPLQLPKTEPESMPLYSMPTTTPYNAGQQQMPRSRTPLLAGGAVAVIGIIGLIAWSFRSEMRDTPQPETANQELKPKETEPSRVSNVVTPSSEKPTPSARLAAAREQAAAAAKEKRYSDVVNALETVFEQASATSDDYVMRGNSWLALADAGESPAENYARAAADFENAELPREQLRALTRQGRWLVEHNFAKQAIAPLRQVLALKKSADVQWTLCQALLATGDAKAARDEAIVALAELPKQPSDSDMPFAARLHHIVSRACLALSKQAEADPDKISQLEPLDLETDQHYQDAVALATSSKLDERAEWQDELSAFRKLPRIVAREERRLRKERITELTKAAEQSPTVAAKWLELAELEKLDGQAKLASTHFGRGYSLQALTHARAGKLDDAIKSEALATENEADFAALYSARALIAASQERDRDAVKLLEEALTRTPTKSTDRWQILADRAAAFSRLAAGMSGTRQDWEKSQTDFESAIANYPPTSNSDDNASTQQTLARLHFEHAMTCEALAISEGSKIDLPRLALAEKALLSATTLNPKEPRFALAAGQNLLRQVHNAAPGFAELLDRAVVLLTTATKLDDKQAEAYFSLGDCQVLRGKNAEAQVAFDNAVKHADGAAVDRQFQFSLSQSLAYLRVPRDDTKALAAAERAIALQQADAAGHFARGLSLRNLKRVNDAISAFNDTIAVQPKHAGALLARSQLIIEHQNSTAKQIEQAAQDIENALAAATTDEQTAEAHYVRSLVSLKTHVSSVTQAGTAEPALLKAQRDVLQAVKLVPANMVYSQAATDLFDYASKFVWADSQRKADSETLQRELKMLRKK